MAENGDRLTALCEKCGKKYTVPATSVKGPKARFKCKQCGDIVVVKRDDHGLPNWVNELDENESIGKNMMGEDAPGSGQSTSISGDETKGKKRIKVRRKNQPFKFGLTPKFMFFILIPLVIISFVSIYISINKTLKFHGLTIQESSKIVSGIGTDMISHISESVAIQTRLYLFSHPDLKNEEFNRDIYFKKVALQRIGATGHTSLIELPGPDNVWRCWAHIDSRAVGKNLKKLKKPVWTNTPEFWQILSRVKNNRESKGYYKWADEDGKLRDKFMVCRSIGGTPYAIVASIYVDEFTKPIRQLESTGKLLAGEMRNSHFLIMGLGLLSIGLITFFYGRNLTGRIKYLSKVTDRISLGKIDEQIKVNSKDEIGDLGKAIGRMQVSISVSMDMLEKRR